MGYPREVLRGSTSLHLTIRYITVLIRSPLSSTRLNRPSSQLLLVWQMLQSLDDLDAPWPGLCPVCPRLPCTGEPRTGHSTASEASPVLSRGAEWTPSIFWQHFSQYSPGAVSCLCCKGTLLASLLFTKSFSAKLCLSSHPTTQSESEAITRIFFLHIDTKHNFGMIVSGQARGSITPSHYHQQRNA